MKICVLVTLMSVCIFHCALANDTGVEATENTYGLGSHHQCVDKIPKCNKKKCDEYYYAHYCAKTCGRCQDQCEDLHYYCQYWKGYCQHSYFTYLMKIWCPNTCGECGKGVDCQNCSAKWGECSLTCGGRGVEKRKCGDKTCRRECRRPQPCPEPTPAPLG